MLMPSETGRAVTARLRKDGTLDLEREPVIKPLSIRLLDWTLALLWCLVAGVLVATGIAILVTA